LKPAISHFFTIFSCSSLLGVRAMAVPTFPEPVIFRQKKSFSLQQTQKQNFYENQQSQPYYPFFPKIPLSNKVT